MTEPTASELLDSIKDELDIFHEIDEYNRHSPVCDRCKLDIVLPKLRVAIARLEAEPKALTPDEFQTIAQAEWFERDEKMPKFAPDVFAAIYEAIAPYLATAQSARHTLLAAKEGK